VNHAVYPCVACLSAATNRFGHRGAYTYYRCRDCGTLQLAPMPSTDTMREAYQRDYSDAGHCQADPDRRNMEAKPQFDAICDALLSHAKPGLVLDYGAGWGGLSVRLRNRGITVEATELSSSMATHCESQGIPVQRAELNNISGNSVYDAIVLSSVFEHLLEHEGWARDARRLLKPDGLVVTLQPTAAFATFGGMVARFGLTHKELPLLHQVFWPPWHTVLFSLQGMRSLFERTGFELLEVRPAPLQRQAGYVGLAQRVVSTANALATPFFGNKWPLHVGHIFVFRKRCDCVP